MQAGQLRVRKGVWHFAASGETFAISMLLGWTPAEPWIPAATVLNAAGDVPVLSIMLHVAASIAYEVLPALTGCQGHCW